MFAFANILCTIFFKRHRQQRDAYSAFMDRVEEKFTKTCKQRWAKVLRFVVEHLQQLFRLTTQTTVFNTVLYPTEALLS